MTTHLHQILTTPWLTNSTFGLTNSATISAWINLASNSESGAFVKIGDGNPNIDGYGFGVGDGDMDNSGNKLLMVAEGRGWMRPDVSLTSGTWTHVAMTLKPGAVNETLFQAWVNGIAVGPEYSVFFVRPPTTITGLGGYDNHRVANLALDDVQIYNEALTSSQIAFLANNPGVAVPEASSFLYLAMPGLLFIGVRRWTNRGRK